MAKRMENGAGGGGGTTQRLDRIRIELVQGAMPAIVAETEEAIIKHNLPIYDRANRLVLPIEKECEDAEGRKFPSIALGEIGLPRMLLLMDEACIFQKYDGRKRDFVSVDAPERVGRSILDHAGAWPFPEIINIVAAQSLDRKGDIIDRPGLHRPSKMLFAGLPPLPASMPRHPERQDALDALALLDGLLKEFPFDGPVSKAVALSQIVSTVLRAMLSTVPMHAVTAPEAGSGKSYLATLTSLIATGRACPVIPATSNAEEFEKRLTGALLSGAPIVSFDNLDRPLKSALLCQALTEPMVEVRPLGTSQLMRIEQRATYFANGNNLEIVGDLARRTLLATLDSGEERPELREFNGHPAADILEDRGRYIAACLTIVRAYVLATRPEKLSPLASFEAWSDNVRSALVWLGCEDPCASIETIRKNDQDRDNFAALLAAWPEHGKPFLASEMIKIAAAARDMAFKKARDASFTDDFSAPEEPALWLALREIADDRKGGIDAGKLGYYLRKMKSKVATVDSGMRVKLLKGDKKHQAVQWIVERLNGL